MNVEKLSILITKAQMLPTGSGCYLFYKKVSNKNSEILYVGKAKNLKNRVKSYFNKSNKTVKTKNLIKNIDGFDFIVTSSEVDAFVLENNLIKKYLPRYNILLKDDKSYPYVVINMQEDYPRIQYTRKVSFNKGHKIFGPYPTGSNISKVVKILSQQFKLRDCTLKEFKSRSTPCLLYQMRQCSAPCVDKITIQDYKQGLNLIISFLSKRSGRFVKDLEESMDNSAKNENFEYAAVLRDNIQILKDFILSTDLTRIEDQTIDKSVDVIAIFTGINEVDISLSIIRDGRLIGIKNFNFIGTKFEEKDEFTSFIMQYYVSSKDRLPSVIVTNQDEDQHKILEAGIMSLREDFNGKIRKVGRKYKYFFETTLSNAKEKQEYRIKNKNSPFLALEKLKDLLKLSEIPVWIECFDIAIWQGYSPTGSQVVFYNGGPFKKKYRHYHLEELPEGNNDFHMMKELVKRRLNHGELPDLFVVDGGKGQVNAFCEILKEERVSIAVVGIAKSRIKHGSFKKSNVEKSQERLVIPGRINDFILKKDPSLLKLMTGLRDEAHRFSRVLHHKTEKKRLKI